VDQQHTDTGPLCGAQTDFENRIAQNRKKSLAFALRLTHGNRSEAEDLVQEATLRAWGAFTRFEQVKNFQTWFLRILTNVFLDKNKRRARTECSLDAFNEDLNPVLAITDTYSLEQNEISEIHEALAELPEDLRVVIQIISFDDCSFAEVAETLNIPIGMVRSRKRSAYRILRKKLAHLMPTDPK